MSFYRKDKESLISPLYRIISLPSVQVFCRSKDKIGCRCLRRTEPPNATIRFRQAVCRCQKPCQQADRPGCAPVGLHTRYKIDSHHFLASLTTTPKAPCNSSKDYLPRQDSGNRHSRICRSSYQVFVVLPYPSPTTIGCSGRCGSRFFHTARILWHPDRLFYLYARPSRQLLCS